MPRYATIKLTKKEAMAIIEALGNTTGHNDVLVNCFNFDYRSINACLRGQNKIEKAIGMTGDNRMLSKEDYDISYDWIYDK